ncbi:MAG TPA: bifunctional 2-polyprenyl-6-hydroxyphenol methylase/3-demethylubiquinol 3-O-methyltransferase UbiG [Burkholderiaceae bacterium]|nr:bifunctional 2-polyprenyl-6-hydroxyphenol methylase/3-demethylubiquinol 3-O-methyltransferase UbiG [Burkholderiaceae bacterium]
MRCHLRVQGVDDRAVVVLRARQEQGGGNRPVGRVELLLPGAQQQSDAFDFVTCMEMLEHVPHPALVIDACARTVKPGGWVLFSTINRTALAWRVAIVGAERLLRILPPGTHDYRKFIQPDELKSDAKAAGLSLRDQRGLGYNPFTRKFKLHRFLGVGYLLAMQRGNAR